MASFNYHTTTKRLLGDLYTPVSLYMRLRDLYPQSMLMESSDYHGSENAKSFIGIDPMASIQVAHGTLTMTFPDGSSVKRDIPVENSDKPKLAVAKAMNDFWAVSTSKAKAANTTAYSASRRPTPCATSRTYR